MLLDQCLERNGIGHPVATSFFVETSFQKVAASVFPVPEQSRETHFVIARRRPVCVLTINTYPSSLPIVDRDLLQARYGLSNKETDLALDLTLGKSLKSIALQEGRSYETFRKTIASILRKTGTNTQGELVSILLTDKTLRTLFEIDVPLATH